MRVRYIGEGPSGIRLGDKEIMPGDEFTTPLDLVEYLGRFMPKVTAIRRRVVGKKPNPREDKCPT